MTAWTGHSRGHAKAGRIGGSKQSKEINPANFANDRELAKKAGSLGGKRRWEKVKNEKAQHQEADA